MNNRHHDRLALLDEYNQTIPGDWDPSNLVQKCTKVLLPGEPCCDADGSNCHDWKCGAPGAHWGVGWPTMEQEFSGLRNGKCGLWGGGGLDPARFPNADGSPNYRYTERCCPWTVRGSQTVGFQCHDLPFGALVHGGQPVRRRLGVWLQQHVPPSACRRGRRAATPTTVASATTSCAARSAPTTASAGQA